MHASWDALQVLQGRSAQRFWLLETLNDWSRNTQVVLEECGLQGVMVQLEDEGDRCQEFDVGAKWFAALETRDLLSARGIAKPAEFVREELLRPAWPLLGARALHELTNVTHPALRHH